MVSSDNDVRVDVVQEANDNANKIIKEKAAARGFGGGAYLSEKEKEEKPKQPREFNKLSRGGGYRG